MSKRSNPSFEEIIELAEECGFSERRSSVSATLFFIEDSPAFGMPPVRINVYPTTRSIMTHLNHPSASTNELWRSNAYQDLEELRQFFENPRVHTGKGYRSAGKAVRGCVQCGDMKQRREFSENQWRKGPDSNRCKTCVQQKIQMKKEEAEEDEEDLLVELTQHALQIHDDASSKKKVKNNMQRRQFNCPDCPKHGRGTFVFFKKVPIYKPIVKCPQCKKATRGRCQRLYPIPREAERGYGLYRCTTCRDTWGSSRAVGNIGQECHTCLKQGRPAVWVKPFRMEVLKKKKKGIGPSRMRRVPREPIHEDKADQRQYTNTDYDRHLSGAGNALVGGGQEKGGSFTRSYDFEAREDTPPGVTPDPVASSSTVGLSRIPKDYRHKCSGCATGICKSRRIPKSEVHDRSDGDTVSTRASVVTNSSVDKTEFVDRDEDFSGFDLDDEEEWIEV